MKFLIVGINSKFIHSNPAVYSLARYAETLRPETEEYIETAEYCINQELKDILADIYMKRPTQIGFSCYIWNIDYVMRLAEDLSKLMPDVPVWLGGPECSYNSEEVLRRNPFISGIFIKEGEETFFELLMHYASGAGQIKDIAGLCIRQGEEIFHTAQRRPLDMDCLPFIYQDFSEFRNRIIYYETSRGCPFSCSYCLSSEDNDVRFRSLSKVFRELDCFLEAGVHQVKFVDRTFNCSRKRAREIWRYLKEHDNGVTGFHFEIGADLIEEEDIELLRTLRPGLIQLEIGVQTTNDSTAAAVCRTAPFDKIAWAVKRIAAGNNIHQHLDLIAGLPFEDYETFRKSFNDVYALHPDQLQLGFLKVLKGTCMERRAKEWEIVYSACPPYEVLCTDWLCYDEIVRLKKIEAQTEWYCNSGQYPASMRYLEYECGKDMFGVFEAMSIDYDREVPVGTMQGRRQQFSRLLEFMRKHIPGKEELQKQILLLDYYRRDPSAAKPEFDSSQPDKVRIKRFYIKEAEERRFLPAYSECTGKVLQHQTHIEHFDWNLWEFAEGEELKKGDFWYLFDYRERDFRYGNARVKNITECI